MEEYNKEKDAQFLTEVFPEELKEIKKRQENLTIVPNKHINEAIKAYEDFSNARREYENAIKKKHIILHLITEAKEKIANIKLLKKLGKLISSKTNQPPEKSLEELKAEKNKAEELFKKDGSPSTNLGLVGLALSGGGIRSATFNLGVIQVLAKRGILKDVDYLSTVSGGGYIGSCLSSILNNPEIGPEKEKFPFCHERGTSEPEAMKHLRRYCNYLTPEGIWDTLRIPALLLRGVMINLFVLSFYVMIAVGLTQFLHHCFPHYSDVKALRRYIIVGAVSFFVLLTITFPFISRCCKNKLKWNGRNLYETVFSSSLLIILVALLIVLVPSAYLYYKHIDWLKDFEWLKPTVVGIATFIPVIFAGKAAEKISKWGSKFILYILGAIGPFAIFVIYLYLCDKALNASSFYIPLIIYGIGFVLFLYSRILVDINTTSLHNFYRDRLSKVFLFQTDAHGNIMKHNDEQKLSTLSNGGTKAPYHLINVSLNLQGSKNINLRGRGADYFILSKHFFGSKYTGYYSTADLENVFDPHINLGTAMAISGAAASPNMGTITIKPLVFIMALLNIRLGYWLPNPYKLRYSKCKWWSFGWNSPISGVGPWYLFKELLGFVHEYSKYVNITDGGHIENLGIFELLRRRCKYIIACDAEADPTMTFGGLAKLIRYARTDLSIDIEIDLDDVRKGENGFSHSHCTFGKIDYGNGEIGYLLYIKSSMTGDENEYIREYRSKNEAFPHESTADQFFDEAQFEAYRALGYHITDKLEGWEILEPERERSKIDDWCWANAVKWEMGCEIENQRERRLDEWFKIQESSLLSRYRMEEKFVDLQIQLSRIEKMYQDPAIAEYTYQVYPELLSDKKKLYNAEKREISPGNECGQDEENLRKIFHFCNQQMQLMENVFVALQLDKPYNRDHHLNRGWMNLFIRWAKAPFFRHSWEVSIDTYSLGFQKFCEDALNLSRKV